MKDHKEKTQLFLSFFEKYPWLYKHIGIGNVFDYFTYLYSECPVMKENSENNKFICVQVVNPFYKTEILNRINKNKYVGTCELNKECCYLFRINGNFYISFKLLLNDKTEELMFQPIFYFVGYEHVMKFLKTNKDIECYYEEKQMGLHNGFGNK